MASTTDNTPIDWHRFVQLVIDFRAIEAVDTPLSLQDISRCRQVRCWLTYPEILASRMGRQRGMPHNIAEKAASALVGLDNHGMATLATMLTEGGNPCTVTEGMITRGLRGQPDRIVLARLDADTRQRALENDRYCANLVNWRLTDCLRRAAARAERAANRRSTPIDELQDTRQPAIAAERAGAVDLLEISLMTLLYFTAKDEDIEAIAQPLRQEMGHVWFVRAEQVRPALTLQERIALMLRWRMGSLTPASALEACKQASVQAIFRRNPQELLPTAQRAYNRLIASDGKAREKLLQAFNELGLSIPPMEELSALPWNPVLVVTKPKRKAKSAEKQSEEGKVG